MSSTIQVDNIKDIGGNTIISSDGSGTFTSNLPASAPNVSTATGTLPIANGGTGAATLAAAGLTNTPSFKAHYDGDPNNAQDIPSGAFTVLALDGEVFDTDSAYNTSNYKFTIPSGKAGKYYFHAQIYWNETPVTQPRIYIYKNGNQFARWGSFDTTTQPTNFEYHMHTISVLDNSSVGDYYEARVYQGSGSNKHIWGGNMGTFFEGFKLL